MHPRAERLVRLLALSPHPEGGAYREVFRSSRRVTAPDGGSRAALTTIYFLLEERQHSRWHRVPHDETWHYYQGSPMALMWLAPDLERIERRALGPVASELEASSVMAKLAGVAATHPLEAAAAAAGAATAAVGSAARVAVEPVLTVPAGCWQTAFSLGPYSLAGCTMGPGFEFEEFELLRANPAELKRLESRHPSLAHLA